MWKLGMAAIAASLSLTAAPASAYITTVTYQGHVYSTLYSGNEYSFDTEGVFGAQNTSLVGLAYALTFVVDMGPPYDRFDSMQISVRGGPAYGTPNPVLYSGITINGITQTVSPDRYSDYYWTQNRPYGNGIQTDSISEVARLSVYSGWDWLLDTPVNGTFSVPATGWGEFRFLAPDGRTARANGHIDVNRVSWYSSGSAVPEPATWATMILGFGIAGAALRRRTLHA